MRYYKLLFLFLMLIIISCKKEEIVKHEDPYYIYDQDGDGISDTIIVGDTPNTNYIPDSLILGYEWRLIDGRVYVENLDNGYKNVYNYFDDTTNIASLSLFDPSVILMDEIEKDVTTWYFSNDTFLQVPKQ